MEAQAADTTRTALLQAALLMLPPSSTSDELVERFEEAGAQLLPGLAAELLEGLTAMGLARPTGGRDSRRYVPSSLGNRAVQAAMGGETVLRLEELERLRTDLLATIAHELRTPLTVIRTNIGLLLDRSTHPSEEQRLMLLESIERNGDRMQRLIGDVLELARFRAGTIALQLRSFRAMAVAEAAIADGQVLASQRGVRIELNNKVAADHRVYGDRRRLEQALLNLITNALRFSPEGGLVQVLVGRRRKLTAWQVVDEGPGITPEDQARLFERFFVGRSDRSGGREGVGLGLPTALAIAQAHGGEIEVDSALGQGSRFTLVVPTAGPGDQE